MVCARLPGRAKSLKSLLPSQIFCQNRGFATETSLGTDGTFSVVYSARRTVRLETQLSKNKKARRTFPQSNLLLEIYGGDDETRTRDLCRDSLARHTRIISALHSRGGCQVAERDCRNRSLWVSLWVRIFASNSSCLAALRALAADQSPYTVMNLVAYRSDCLDGLPFRIGQRPVDDAQTGNVRTSLPAHHRHEN